MNCECEKYDDIPLNRESINKRIKESKKLKKQLESIAEYGEGYSYHKLLRCPVCGRLWQQSSAWNFGAKEYLFKVPQISFEDWKIEPYAQPDEIMIYGALNEEVLSQSFEERDCLCLEEGCRKYAIRWHSLCKERFLASRHLMPKDRMFAPYEIVYY